MGTALMKALVYLNLQKAEISIFCPYTTHALQPLDKAEFGPFNKVYNKACSEYLSASPVNQVTKWTFPHLFKMAWDEGVTEKNIKSGFAACGIYPLDPMAISQESFLPSEPTNRLVTSESYSTEPETANVPLMSTVSSLSVRNESVLPGPSDLVPIAENCSTSLDASFQVDTSVVVLLVLCLGV